MKKWCGLVCGLLALMVISAGFITAKARAADAITIEAVVSPSTLVLSSSGTWVSVHTDIPYGEVATMSLSLNEVDVAWTKSDAKGNLVAKFNLDDVKGIVAPPSAFLVLSGITVDGVPFSGSDTIGISSGTKKK